MSSVNTREVAERAGRFAAAVPVVERIEAGDARLASIETERRELAKRTWPPKADLAAGILGLLAELRDDYTTTSRGAYDLSRTLADLVTAATERRPLRVRDETDVLKIMAFLLGPVLEESVPAAVERLEYVAGRSREERRQRLAALAAERESLVAERRRLVETAREAGVTVDHLPETQAAIDAEAAAARRAERTDSERAVLEAEADRRRGDPQSPVGEHLAKATGRRAGYVESSKGL